MKHKPIRTIRQFKHFDLVEEEWRLAGTDPTVMEVYRTKDGAFIECRHRGKRPNLIKHIARLGIWAEPGTQGSDICTIGKSDVDGRWYGWSHRAIQSFGLGDKIFEERFNSSKMCRSCKKGEACEGRPCPSSIPFREHGRRTVKTDADAKQAATNFANYIS